MNNMHEVLVYKDYFGISSEDLDPDDIAEAEPTGALKLIARVSVP